MSSILSRGHGLSVLKKIKLTQDKETSRELIKDELPPLISSILEPEEIDELNVRLVKIDTLPLKKEKTVSDLRAALIIFLLVFTCTFPVVLPFIFLNNTALALRMSNAIALLILFVGGFSVGKYAGFHPFLTGTMLTVLGIILVAITMALGG